MEARIGDGLSMASYEARPQFSRPRFHAPEEPEQLVLGAQHVDIDEYLMVL
jgi:hypothetical protein